MTESFVRKHHRMAALALLLAAALAYVIGFAAGAVVLLAAALLLELIGWSLLLVRSTRRGKSAPDADERGRPINPR